MPIFEFKCLKCSEMVECLMTNTNQELEMKCPKCSSFELERVLSTTNYSMNNSSSIGAEKAASKTRTCQGGSCTTYNIQGG